MLAIGSKPPSSEPLSQNQQTAQPSIIPQTHRTIKLAAQVRVFSSKVISSPKVLASSPPKITPENKPQQEVHPPTVFPRQSAIFLKQSISKQSSRFAQESTQQNQFASTPNQSEHKEWDSQALLANFQQQKQENTKEEYLRTWYQKVALKYFLQQLAFPPNKEVVVSHHSQPKVFK